MKKYLISLLITILFFGSYNVGAADVMHRIRDVSFNSILFVSGSCELDPNSMALTDLPGSQLCVNSTSGTTGKYTLVTEPNKIVNIRVIQTPPANGINFLPKGVITSSVASVNFDAGLRYQINSGIGAVDIIIGGRLFINANNNLVPGTTYDIELTDSIEWSVED